MLLPRHAVAVSLRSNTEDQDGSYTLKFDVFSRVSCRLRCVSEVTMPDRPRQLPHCKSHKSAQTPSCSRDVDGRLREADGWQPKSFPQHLVGETSLLGVTRSPTAVAQAL